MALHAGDDLVGEADEQRAEDVGDHQIGRFKRRAAAPTERMTEELRRHAVLRRVLLRGGDGFGIDVEAGDRRVAELCRGDGKDARAAAHVQQRARLALDRRKLVDVLEACASRFVATGAKGEPGVELDDRQALPLRLDEDVRAHELGLEMTAVG